VEHIATGVTTMRTTTPTTIMAMMMTLHAVLIAFVV